MPTVAEVHSAIKTRLAANFSAITVRYKNESSALPNTPAAFVYVELIVEDAEIVAYGGGRGSNLQRTNARIEAHVLTPVGWGVADGLGYAESIAAVFRGQRVDDISYFDAEVFPADGRSEDGSYAIVATAIVSLFFDKAA